MAFFSCPPFFLPNLTPTSLRQFDIPHLEWLISAPTLHFPNELGKSNGMEVLGFQTRLYIIFRRRNSTDVRFVQGRTTCKSEAAFIVPGHPNDKGCVELKKKKKTQTHQDSIDCRPTYPRLQPSTCRRHWDGGKKACIWFWPPRSSKVLKIC